VYPPPPKVSAANDAAKKMRAGLKGLAEDPRRMERSSGVHFVHPRSDPYPPMPSPSDGDRGALALNCQNWFLFSWRSAAWCFSWLWHIYISMPKVTLLVRTTPCFWSILYQWLSFYLAVSLILLASQPFSFSFVRGYPVSGAGHVESAGESIHSSLRSDASPGSTTDEDLEPPELLIPEPVARRPAPAVVPEVPSELPPAPPPPPEHRRENWTARATPFGPWTFSAIHHRGTLVGWQGNCGCHHDVGQAETCKRQFWFRNFSSDETRRQCKKWLLMGSDIPEDSMTGRTQHMFHIPRLSIPLNIDEGELDNAAEALRRPT